MNIDSKNNDYFEIKKLEIENFEKLAKKQKAFLLRADITAAVMSILTSYVYGTHGMNPFLAFAGLFTLPIGMIVFGNIKTLLLLKKKRLELMKESESINEISEIDNGSKKL